MTTSPTLKVNAPERRRLGPRVLDELLQEMGAERFCMTAIEMKLERYARLGRDVVTAVGAGRPAAPPIHEVP